MPSDFWSQFVIGFVIGFVLMMILGYLWLEGPR